jgi:hypothetical protein
MKHFSERHGFSADEAPITIRDGAPEPLRNAVWALAVNCGAPAAELAKLIFVIAPAYGPPRPGRSITAAQQVLGTCDWFRVYDLAEQINFALSTRWKGRSDQFEKESNDFFRAHGIGWQMIDGEIEVRGPSSFEVSMRRNIETLKQGGNNTAENEFQEANRALSRRPTPDITGAIQHASAALECVARDFTGESKKTFGQLLNDYPKILPTPLDEAAHKLWGFVSSRARHIAEGKAPEFADASLAVGIASSFAAFLVHTKK